MTSAERCFSHVAAVGMLRIAPCAGLVLALSASDSATVTGVPTTSAATVLKCFALQAYAAMSLDAPTGRPAPTAIANLLARHSWPHIRTDGALPLWPPVRIAAARLKGGLISASTRNAVLGARLRSVSWPTTRLSVMPVPAAGVLPRIPGAVLRGLDGFWQPSCSPALLASANPAARCRLTACPAPLLG